MSDNLILGWSEGFHDAAATIINGNTGSIVFASHSERHSGNKHEKHISPEFKTYIEERFPNIKKKAFFEKPALKKSRQLYSGQYKTVATKRQLAWKPDVKFHHHKSHAAGTFQTSPYQEAAAVVVDSIGEWDCTTIWKCSYDKSGRAVYKKVYNERYPNSIGLWYTALTHFVGLKPLDEEYIFMGMAAFGKVEPLLLDKLEDLFNYNLHKGIPIDVSLKHMLNEYRDVDIAFNAQLILEEKLKDIFDRALEISDNVVYGGGVALNCVANTKLHQQCKGNLWIMPNPGDAGASLGAAALAYGKKVVWTNAFLGHRTEQSLTRTSLQLAEQIVAHLLEHKVCGVAFGRAEFGPRALGNRSLIADPRGPDMKDKVNEIKKRQKFRPFAPAVLEEHAAKYFHPDIKTPYMQHVVNGTKITQKTLPAIVHQDGTCRVQTIAKYEQSIFRQILEIWYRETGCPVLLNTSLNIRGEPMVNTVEDAWRFEEKYDVKVFY
jgi:carbamoyltransferase